MDWFFTVKIVFGAALNVIITSPPEFTTKADCLIYGLDTAIERAAWRQPEKIEVTCATPMGVASATIEEDPSYLYGIPQKKDSVSAR